MNAEILMKRILEYATSTNHCCAFVGDCIHTNKCLVDETIVGCSQRYEFKKIKKALEAQEKLIHCKDCEKWDTPYCPFYANYITVMPNKNQYCSLAKRKKKNDDQ